MAFLIDRFDVYVRANILSAVLDAVAIGGAAWAFGIEGAILALLVVWAFLRDWRATWISAAWSTTSPPCWPIRHSVISAS